VVEIAMSIVAQFIEKRAGVGFKNTNFDFFLAPDVA